MQKIALLNPTEQIRKEQKKKRQQDVWSLGRLWVQNHHSALRAQHMMYEASAPPDWIQSGRSRAPRTLSLSVSELVTTRFCSLFCVVFFFNFLEPQ